jgi:hypothetical protein
MTNEDFVKGSEMHLHHVWCNYFSLSREGCKQCERLFERYPMDRTPDEMAKKHFPDAIPIKRSK